MNLKRSAKRLLFAAAMVSLAVASNAASALERPKGYPARTIEIINPFKAGGSTDVYLRTLIPALERTFGARVMVVNLTGGEGVRAFDDVMSRPADGHSIYAIGPEELINTVFGRVDVSKLTPVARVEQDVSVFWVGSDSPFKTWQDMVSFAKSKPNQLVIGGSYGIDQIVTSILLKQAGDLQAKFIPFSVGNEATAGLLGGHVMVLHEEPGGLTGQIEAGLVRPVLSVGNKRLAKFPDAVTTSEMQYGVTLSRWRGVAVKNGTPPEIVDYLSKAFEEAAKSPEYKALAARLMTDLNPGYLNAKDFAAFLDKDLQIYKREMPLLGMVK